jgi:cysteine-rich repeat protein
VFCQAATCGDGFLWAGNEECDDGNDDDSDACPTSCEDAYCGDGFKWQGSEECDDGNNVDDDGCQNSCIANVLPNLMRCGNSGRDVSVFLPQGYNMQVVVGCTPDEDTQALVITRSGNNMYNANEIKTYVEGGGIVLTEYSASDEVFNAVFGGGASENGSHGSCRDVAPTVVQFNQNDQFWQDNQWQAIQLADSGCGRVNVDSWNGVTALAGWDNSNAAIGYREAGSGRVWLTDFDWQDNENYPFDYTADLMKYMVITK